VLLTAAVPLPLLLPNRFSLPDTASIRVYLNYSGTSAGNDILRALGPSAVILPLVLILTVPMDLCSVTSVGNDIHCALQGHICQQ